MEIKANPLKIIRGTYQCWSLYINNPLGTGFIYGKSKKFIKFQDVFWNLLNLGQL